MFELPQTVTCPSCRLRAGVIWASCFRVSFCYPRLHVSLKIVNELLLGRDSPTQFLNILIQIIPALTAGADSSLNYNRYRPRTGSTKTALRPTIVTGLHHSLDTLHTGNRPSYLKALAAQMTGWCTFRNERRSVNRCFSFVAYLAEHKTIASRCCPTVCSPVRTKPSLAERSKSLGE